MKRRKLFIISLILILALVFAGCSSDKSENAVPDSGAVSSIKDGSSSTVPDSDVSDSGITSPDTSTAKPETKETEKPVSETPESSLPELSDSSTIHSYSDPTLIGESKVSMDSIGSYDGFYSATKESGEARSYAGDYFDGSYIPSDELPDDFIIPDPIEPIEPEITPLPQATAGLLTAGEWNDNRNFDFLKKLISDGQNYDYKKLFTSWELSPFNRLVITCTDSEGKAVQGAKVNVTDANGNSIWKGVTDHTGTAYAYYALLDPDMMPAKIHAETNSESADYDVTSNDLIDTAVITLTLNAEPKIKTLDLMFTVDTTGSMGDEIYYLQAELQDVIKRVQNDTANIPVRLSVNFYRDVNDEYVVRPYEFSTNINEQLAYLNREYANGGGDFEEAVEQALESSIKDHTWDENSIKLLFLVLDAPPHNTPEIRQSLINTLSLASEKGIRIIPVASSGIDKETEFILRAFAMTTGGTYTFLTNHSGIGGDHIEPTVGDYTVEQLNDLLVRIIEEYIG